MALDNTTPAPPPPPSGPSDWTAVVHGNGFTNVERLAIWVGGTTPVASGVDPSSYFWQLDARPIGAPVEGVLPVIYVVVHGWAMGYRPAVDAAGGNLLWWGSKASMNGRWASDWAWAPVGPLAENTFPVNPTGVLQQIMQYDPNALALAYSWIDDSATDNSYSSDYASEASTHLNGIRLANALQEAIQPSFFQAGGLIRLIGHSHGSKVCTVATMTLQRRGIQVAHLTLLDSPETTLPLDSNGANLLGFYLEQLEIQDPSLDCARGVLVDNYASCFGVGYASSDPKSPVNHIVEVALAPSEIYGRVDLADAHTYAAGWYGGAAAGAAAQDQPPVGLAWPPVPAQFKPAMNQTWPGGGHAQSNQWLLAPGPSIIGSYSYTPAGLAVATSSSSGNVSGNPATALYFGPNGTSYSTYVGTYPTNNTDQYGFAFDLGWSSPQPGDYLVVTAGGWSIYTLLVIDGQSLPSGLTSIAINSDVWGSSTASLTIYFYSPSNVPGNQVTISNFRWIAVESADGSLAAHRAAKALQARAS